MTPWIIGGALYALAIVWFGYELMTAPYGYQDSEGFHLDGAQ